MVFALIPVGLFLLMLANLVYASLWAITSAGLPVLFSTRISNVFSGQYIPGQYGLLPALWGTLMIAVIALMIGLPIALLMAVFASEFSLGGLGRVMEGALGLFAGIPPVIYALLSLLVAQVFMQPKFAGEGLPEAVLQAMPGLPTWNAGMLPREQSALLGGILLSLLVIPFMAPLMLDAIRNVAHSQKEASLALGATRWYTLLRVVLPAALPGLIGAISLGTLKVIGDVVIVAWAVGYYHDGMPGPLWDAWERVAPLSSTGAGFIGGLSTRSGGAPPVAAGGGSVASFAGLLLVVIAFFILWLANLLQRQLQRRHTL
jgi:phosphate transport system permease protein